jgi:hypothetical protein
MVSWRWVGLRRRDDEERSYEPFLREMNTIHKEMDRLVSEEARKKILHIDAKAAQGLLEIPSGQDFLFLGYKLPLSEQGSFFHLTCALLPASVPGHSSIT